MDSKFVIGLDYGSDSARAIVVNALTGETLATAVQYYPVGKKACIAILPSINTASIRKTISMCSKAL